MSDRVEVGTRYITKYDPFTVERYNSETDWAVRWDDGLRIAAPEYVNANGNDTFAGYCKEFEAVLP